ncbi:hypothetical protein, partial [Enterobacter cloacae]|uniref:hypothetical protein n=2 Tax=Enterobacter cloacae TaxID=550 RepID=UPI00390589ED
LATAMIFFIFRLSCQLPDGVNLNTAGAGYKHATHGGERQVPGISVITLTQILVKQNNNRFLLCA